MMDPELSRLADKYTERLLFDAVFVFKVKMLYKLFRSMAPERNAQDTKAEAYLAVCILEEAEHLV